MVDLSKIDWTKCDLDGVHRVIRFSDTIQITAPSGITVASMKTDRGWKIHGCLHSQALAHISRQCAKVDAFIAAETALIEAEEEAKNWIAVPWQDVEWLYDQGVTVFYSWPGETSRLQFGVVGKPSEGHRWDYNADQRTLPSGYDPEKPRFVEIACNQVAKLAQSGAKIYTWAGSWTYRCYQDAPTAHNGRYAIDIHSLGPGVPLHEEPRWVGVSYADAIRLERHGVKWNCSGPGLYDGGDGFKYPYRVDISTLPPGVPLREEPKPVTRPCSKAFALTHPNESEYRYRYNETTEWFTWDSMKSFTNVSFDYEFRTTAPAETKPRVVAEVAVANLIYKEKVTNTMPLRIWREAVIDFGCDGQDARGRLYIHLGYDDHEISDKAKGKNPRIVLIVDEES